MLRIRPRKTLQALGAACAVVVLAATASGCGSGGSEASDGKSQPITFVGPDKALTAASASYTSVPLAAGYFADEGLDVKIQAVDGATSAVKGVVTGNAFMTYASLASTIAAYHRDPNIRIIGMTNGNIFEIAVPGKSSVRKPADLKGKTIGVPSFTSGSFLYTKGVVKQAGLDPERAVEFLPVGLGAQAAEALRTGKIDAYGGWDSPNLVIGDLLKTKMRVLPSPLNDVTGTSTLVVHADTLEEQPKQVAKLARAFFKAMVFSETNPEAGIGIHFEKFPESRPVGVSKKVAKDQSVRILERRLELTGGKASTGGYGKQDIAEVQDTVDAFAKYGIIEEGIDLKKVDLVDYSLAAQYNDFDVRKVRREAREHRTAEG
ncbi:MAG: PhnD/SsuA/transferrin family substrate-binding protein [Streptosporangiales bacterium]|nr:PhnD/SsuA/transferrin family substrate-binding protein [Streptosporangiales bacterium]